MDAEKKPEQTGSEMRVGAVPHGVEVLLKKASVDPEFRTLLLEQRGDAAKTIGLELTDAERQMLGHIPAEQLEQIINNTKVKPKHRAILLGTVGTLMVAAVISLNSLTSYRENQEARDAAATAGISPDGIRRMNVPSQDAKDANDPNAPADIVLGQWHTAPRGFRATITPNPSDPNLSAPEQQLAPSEEKKAKEVPQQEMQRRVITRGIRPDVVEVEIDEDDWETEGTDNGR